MPSSTALTTSDLQALLQRLSLSPSRRAVLSLRGTPTCLSIARLLLPHCPNLLPVVTAPTPALDAAARQSLAAHSPTHNVAHGEPGLSAGDAARFVASAAVRGRADAVVLTSTRVDAAAGALGLRTGAPKKGRAEGAVSALRLDLSTPGGVLRECDDVLPGAEMLPPGTLSVYRPLIGVAPNVLDATVASCGDVGGGREGDGDIGLGEVDRARGLLGEGLDLEGVLAHGERRRQLVEELRATSDSLLRDATIELSHWGYAAVCRETLAQAWSDVDGGGRELACEVVARLVTHVGGSERPVSFADARLQKTVAELLEPRSSEDVPPGRTVAGVLVRPASGPSAENLRRKNMRRKGLFSSKRGDGEGDSYSSDGRWRRRRRERRAGGDLLLFSREPDRESSHLMSRRMGGNFSAVPLRLGRDETAYWDNRFVVSAAPAADLGDDQAMISDTAVLLAALSPRAPASEDAARDATFYVRQLRSADWEYMTAQTQVVRVRSMRVPLQGVRGLPAVYQKTPGETAAGVLAAVPHMGLSGRGDMIFTAVRLPRWRCLPADLEPGFSVVPGGLLGGAAAEREGEGGNERAA